MRGYESVMALCEFFNYMEYIMKDKELECLFVKHNVPNNISFLAKVQTLLSKHNCKYDYIMSLYNKQCVYNSYFSHPHRLAKGEKNLQKSF